MFEGLKTRPYAREFIQQQVNLGDLSFVHKTQAQLEETKEINGMARLLFPIFLECQFIPVSYVIFLAVLMIDTLFLNIFPAHLNVLCTKTMEIQSRNKWS